MHSATNKEGRKTTDTAVVLHRPQAEAGHRYLGRVCGRDSGPGRALALQDVLDRARPHSHNDRSNLLSDRDHHSTPCLLAVLMNSLAPKNKYMPSLYMEEILTGEFVWELHHVLP